MNKCAVVLESSPTHAPIRPHTHTHTEPVWKGSRFDLRHPVCLLKRLSGSLCNRGFNDVITAPSILRLCIYFPAHIHAHTQAWGCGGGAPIPLWLIFTCLTQEHDWVPTLYTSPHTHTHTSVSPGCWNTAESLCFTFHPPMPLFWFLFFSCLSTSLSFFLSFYCDTLLCGRLKQCRMPLYRSITASSLFLDIYLCLVFFFPGIPLLLLPLSLLLLLLPPLLPYFQAFLSFHRFATLLPPSPTLTSCSFSNSISPLLLQHTKQNFSDYFSSWETLETQVRDPPPLPSAVTMTTATALSFIEEGWKEGGGAGSLLCVVTQR